ncbi:MAG: hypothetical protein ACOC5T_02185 [Elusimicrobiota bacterium]
MKLEIKKNKENYELNVFENNSHTYRNIVDRDPNKIAQIFIDLFIFGFPIEKAIKIFKRKVRQKDWIGL